MVINKQRLSTPEFRELIYGDVAMNRYLLGRDVKSEEPWSSFARARELLLAERAEEATQILLEIAHDPAVETRHALQAWTFLRAAGVRAPSEIAKNTLGVVAKFSALGAHHVVSAYRDGSVHYWHPTGRGEVHNSSFNEALDDALHYWLVAGQSFMAGFKDLSRPFTTYVPRVPTYVPWNRTRISMLTPSGRYEVQASSKVLRRDETFGRFLSAARGLARQLPPN